MNSTPCNFIPQKQNYKTRGARLVLAWTEAWYNPRSRLCALFILLRPLSWLYHFVIWLRSWLYRLRIFSSSSLPVPVIVVGNLVVGGVGKTPLTIALARMLQTSGYRPGIISRGYRGQLTKFVQDVSTCRDPLHIGDEPLLIANQTHCPVFVGQDRTACARELLQKHPYCDIILSDDGLQHTALGRDIDIVVIDAYHLFGNQQCLPTGPLREPLTRLQAVDFIIYNYGTRIDTPIPQPIDFKKTSNRRQREIYAMHIQAKTIQSLTTPHHHLTAGQVKKGGKPIIALAAIGHPERFFETLEQLGFPLSQTIVYPDHHLLTPDEINLSNDHLIIMTEKDAVKCSAYAGPQHFYLPIRAVLDTLFTQTLLSRLDAL